MSGGMKDKMSVGDQQVKFSLSCAKCGEFVEFGVDHECKKEEVDEGKSGSPNSDSA